MVQKVKVKFISLISILVGFFMTYVITPIKNKIHPEGQSGVEFRLINMARPQQTVRAAGPVPLGGKFEFQPTNPVLSVQKINMTLTNGQQISVQRTVDVPAFESWLLSKGVDAKYLSADSMQELYTEFRLENISNQLDRIEGLLRQ